MSCCATLARPLSATSTTRCVVLKGCSVPEPGLFPDAPEQCWNTLMYPPPNTHMLSEIDVSNVAEPPAAC